MKLPNGLTFPIIFFLCVAVFVSTMAEELQIEISSETVIDVDPDTPGDQLGAILTITTEGEGELTADYFIVKDVPYAEYTGFKKFEKVDDNTYKMTIGVILPADEETPPSEDSGESTPPPESSNENIRSVRSSTDGDPTQNPPVQINPNPSAQDGTSGIKDADAISFSELMYVSRGGLHSLAQWIELYNNSDTKTVNLNGWQLEIEARDNNGNHRYVVIRIEELLIKPNDTALIVTWGGERSTDILENQVYNFFDHHFDEFEQNTYRNMVIGQVGFYLKLSDRHGHVSDVIGNLDGDRATEDEPVWKTPDCIVNNRIRTSLMRRYIKETDTPLGGTALNSWRRSADFELLVNRYWGGSSDIGNPGYRDGNRALPVSLSHFRAALTDARVILNWATESELENAGFNVLRSPNREGPFTKINPNLIQGAGTTSDRNEYTWADTTAKPNIEYYYQIEDISFSGVKQTLATKRMKGIHTAKNRSLTSWGVVKTERNK